VSARDTKFKRRSLVSRFFSKFPFFYQLVIAVDKETLSVTFKGGRLPTRKSAVKDFISVAGFL